VTADLLLILIPLAPLMAALAAFAAPRAARRIGLSASLIMVSLSFWLGLQVAAHGPIVHTVGGWPAPLGIVLRADGLSALLLLAVSVVGAAISIYASAYFGAPAGTEASSQSRFFWPLWFFVLAAMNAMFVSGDVFNLYVTLEIQGLAAVALVALAGGSDAVHAALRYLFVSLTGSLFYLTGVAVLYGGTGTLDLIMLRDVVTAEPPSIVALVVMTGGLMMKAALFPMHFWLPPAHSSAPAPVSAALSALVVKGGFYVLLRLWFGPFDDLVSAAAPQLIGVLGVAAIFWGSWQALRQSRLKLLVAYSTVAQIGYLFLVFPLARSADARETAVAGGLVFLLSHAAAKASMFLAAGNVLRAVGNDRIESLAGMTRWMPISAFAVGLAGVSLVGLPPSAGFVGKWLLIASALEQRQWWWVAAILVGSLLAAAYVFRLLAPAFVMTAGDHRTQPVPGVMEWSAFALGALSVVLGLFAWLPADLLGDALSRGAGP
jgi:formate hydrogenlyase subunit 3/multisubunit Na+/H+ antiporter MnhD subunit